MEAKAFMEQVRRAESELKLIHARQRHLREMATSIGVRLTGMPGGQKGASRVEAGAVGIVDLFTELNVKAKEYAELIHKAERLIDKLPQDKFRQVLTLYYLAGWSWKSIRDEMDYKDEKSVYRCHGYALRELQKML